LAFTEVQSDQFPEELSKKYPRVVGAKLARLAIDKSHQRQGIGGVLLAEAMQKALIIADNADVVGLFVDAKDSDTKAYYSQYGFETLQDNLLELFLPLSAVKKLVKELLFEKLPKE
jgi:N-acetylglutamate synthase-like GNAT family acetyltransferase